MEATPQVVSLLFFALAAVAYAISQLQMHGKLMYPGQFWDLDSWELKYANDEGVLVRAPKNWYYSYFKIKYKERFPLSATLLVALTDGYHLMQLIMKLTLCVAVITYKPIIGLYIDAILYYVVFGGFFTLFYKQLSK